QIREPLAPLATKFLEDSIANGQDIARMSQAVQLARSASIPDLDEILTKKVKPAASAALQEMAKSLDGTSAAGKLSAVLLLSDQLQLKEGVDVALAATQIKSLTSYQRSQALFMIAKNGTKDAISKIESLLEDKTDAGSIAFNDQTIKAQMRD